LTGVAFGQQSTTDDILEIIKVGLTDKLLPKELINNIDSIYSTRTNGTYSHEVKHNDTWTVIGIEGTKENGLKNQQHIKWDNKEIWIWGVEDFFAYDIYWLTPTNFKVRVNKISFDFATHTWWDKNVKYYKGTVKAKKTQDKWTVRLTKYAETKNYFEEWDKTRPKHVIQIE
jgi:hypothetical protein